MRRPRRRGRSHEFRARERRQVRGRPRTRRCQSRGGSGDRGAGARGRCRGLRRSARPAARTRAPAEGGSRQDLHPGAGKSVPLLHRDGAGAAIGTRRRLSRDGGLARLSQIAVAAARYARSRRPERRGHGDCARAAAQAARGDPRGR